MSQWEMVKLGEVCEIVTGTTPKSGIAEYWNGTNNWVTPAELSETTCVVSETERKITDIAVKDSSLKPFPKGTVLFSSRAPIGKVAIAGTEMYCNQGFKNFVCSDALFNKYLFWCLKSKKDYFNFIGKGATFKEISKSAIAEVKIPLPPLETQQRMAKTLDLATGIIEGYRQKLTELDKLVQSVFYEMFGDMVFNEHQWNTEVILELCVNKDDIKCGPFGTQLSQSEYQTEGIAVWGIPQINSNFVKKPTDFITESKAYDLQAFSIRSNDIVMSRKGNIGTCALFPQKFPQGILHSDVLRIRVNEEKINSLFMLHQFRENRDIIKQIKVLSTGCIMAGINVTKLKKISVLVPPLPLQEQFVHIVENIEEEKALVQEGLREAEQLFGGLLQEYFEE